ncbi:hypothetical protein [Pandoraea sp. ISTKB]|uniref:hypothetical protein n=1 Tax=Pandoraea sp. ISTKB TaxID=1586708 RepID=UPI0008466B32|nr:hypothetical protein [Pandoraea sp. ISTKB]ODP33128.1 hypothetical protein A9762_20750 [Pandoraea sp. ISTKB]
MLDNLKTLHDAIEAGLKVALPDTVTVLVYPRHLQKVPTPSVVLEMSEMLPGHDPGTGQIALTGHFQARVIVDPLDADADLLVRELSARVALATQGQTWELPATPARLIQVGEDPFRPALDAYIVWLVEWAHEFNLGPVWPIVEPGREITWLVAGDDDTLPIGFDLAGEMEGTS